jgi:hypothetical protein
VGGERRWGKGVRWWIWCKYYMHMYVNGKMRPAETIPGLGEGEESRMVEEGNSSMMYLIYCKNICKNHNIPPPSTILQINQNNGVCVWWRVGGEHLRVSAIST